MSSIDLCDADSNDSVSKKFKADDDKADLSFSSSMAIINKLSSLRNNVPGVGGGSHFKPAELFRKDLISAMKLADSEALHRDDFYLISDHWRQEWEKGVQVPVNPDALKHSNLKVKMENDSFLGPYVFKLPKKLLHAVPDETYRQGNHELHETQKLADEVCRYDLDELDSIWLTGYNELRQQCGDAPLLEYDMERVMETLETKCYDGMQEAMKTVEGLGIEYDEDIVCDICRSPESEDGNEMIFCDSCDICVHQACYGVPKIPEGSWLCRPCALGVKPRCVLCPNLGGAMKSTIDGMRWAHLSCALWIPEIVISDTEKMEPICKISDIPANRWALICSMCRERCGACIQCSVPKCKTAFHVTCAFENNLEMKNNFDEETELVLKAYCSKHSRKHEGDGSPRKTPTSTPKKHVAMTEEEKKADKKRKLEKLAEEFYTYVGDLSSVATSLEFDIDTVDAIYNYWLLKRKCYFNKPLMTPKVEEGDLLLKQNEDGMIARLKMFIHLRQDLERVRNLCYMVTKREKLRKCYLAARREVFFQQVAMLRPQNGRKLNDRDYQSVATVHRESMSIYDRPGEIVRTAQIAEDLAVKRDNEEALDINISTVDVYTVGKLLSPKRLKMRGRRGRPPRAETATVVANVSGTTGTSIGIKKKLTPPQPAENPYAKPTYRSFEWLGPSRRRSALTGSETSTPVSESEKKRKKCGRLRELDFNDSALTTTPCTAAATAEADSMTLDSERSLDVTADSSLSVTLHTDLPASNRVAKSPHESGREVNDSAVVVSSESDCRFTPVKWIAGKSQTPAKDPSQGFAGSTPRSTVKSPNWDSPSRTDNSKLALRHFSDILLSNSPVSDRTLPPSMKHDDELIDVEHVAQNVVVAIAKPPYVVSPDNDHESPVRNGVVRVKRPLTNVRNKRNGGARVGGNNNDKLVNGFRQRTLDGFLQRLQGELINGCNTDNDSDARGNVSDIGETSSRDCATDVTRLRESDSDSNPRSRSCDPAESYGPRLIVANGKRKGAGDADCVGNCSRVLTLRGTPPVKKPASAEERRPAVNGSESDGSCRSSVQRTPVRRAQPEPVTPRSSSNNRAELPSSSPVVKRARVESDTTREPSRDGSESSAERCRLTRTSGNHLNPETDSTGSDETQGQRRGLKRERPREPQRTDTGERCFSEVLREATCHSPAVKRSRLEADSVSSEPSDAGSRTSTTRRSPSRISERANCLRAFRPRTSEMPVLVDACVDFEDDMEIFLESENLWRRRSTLRSSSTPVVNNP